MMTSLLGLAGSFDIEEKASRRYSYPLFLWSSPTAPSRKSDSLICTPCAWASFARDARLARRVLKAGTFTPLCIRRIFPVEAGIFSPSTVSRYETVMVRWERITVSHERKRIAQREASPRSSLKAQPWQVKMIFFTPQSRAASAPSPPIFELLRCTMSGLSFRNIEMSRKKLLVSPNRFTSRPRLSIEMV